MGKLLKVLIASSVAFVFTATSVFANGLANFSPKNNGIAFTDVSPDVWYYSSIEAVAALDLIVGFEDGSFLPEKELNFSEAVALASQVNAVYYDREEEYEVTKMQFSDYWAEGIHKYALKHGILDGMNYVMSNNPCTRAEILTLLYNAVEPDIFPEINVWEYAPEELDLSDKENQIVKIMFLAGIIMGDKDGFHSQETITRAEASIITQRITIPSSRRLLDGSVKNDFTALVGTRIADTASYRNNAAKGQCVWYVRGRAKEKLGVDTGAIGNGNQMWYKAKEEARLEPTIENIKENLIVSYRKGTSSAGQIYGHVIFIEAVDGDTVYYTEGGSGYYRNGTDGVVKVATRQGILDGVNNMGGRMGSDVIGFIDLSKY